MTINIQDKCRELVDREVYVNMSQFVEFALKESANGNNDSPIDYDELYNNKPDFDDLDDDELKELLRDEYNYNDSDLEDLDHYDLVQEVENNWEFPEIYEYWAVSDWLSRKLAEYNEVILDCYPTIWGRCTTGQAILLDSVIVKIVKDLYRNELEGDEVE